MDNNVFARRRESFFSALTQDVENAVAIVPAHPELYRNHDTNFKFRQDSTFHYLTGFDEPDAIAVFRNVRGKKEYSLFVRPKDLSKEIWTGFRCGVDGALTKLGADSAYAVEQFDAEITRLLQGTDRVYYDFFRTLHKNGVEFLDDKILRVVNDYRQLTGRSGRGMVPIHNVYEIVGEMRIFKEPGEIACMKKAADISVRAHKEAMARCRPGVYEYQLDALIDFVFRDAGCERAAYNSIVGSGPNATILHYDHNNRKIGDGELVLIDAGCEWEYYSSDITRTFPSNGKMSDPQRELYAITLEVQKECAKMCRPGATMAGIHEFAVASLTDAMIKLKFLAGSKSELIQTMAYKKYYPHGTGHFLGMDTHDIGLYLKDGSPRKLEPGMVFTVEPGFYVLEQDTSVPEKYRGIGIRIEDDILITASGHEIITSGAPKEIKDVEALVGSKAPLTV